jgi:hypothetical protein
VDQGELFKPLEVNPRMRELKVMKARLEDHFDDRKPVDMELAKIWLRYHWRDAAMLLIRILVIQVTALTAQHVNILRIPCQRILPPDVYELFASATPARLRWEPKSFRTAVAFYAFNYALSVAFELYALDPGVLRASDRIERELADELIVDTGKLRETLAKQLMLSSGDLALLDMVKAESEAAAPIPIVSQERRYNAGVDDE